MKVSGSAHFEVNNTLADALTSTFTIAGIGGQDFYAGKLNIEVRYIYASDRVVYIDEYINGTKPITINIRENSIGILFNYSEASRIEDFAIENNITSVQVYVDNLLRPVVEPPGLVGLNVSADELNRQLKKSDLTTEYLYTPEPVIHPIPRAPIISDPSLVDEAIPVQVKTWYFNSDEEGAEYRYIINTRPNHIFTGEPWEGATQAESPPGVGDYYLHLQARDEDGTLSPTYSYFVRVDNTAPSVLGLESIEDRRVKSHVFNWTSDEPDVEYQYVVNEQKNHTFSDELWRPDTQVRLEGLNDITKKFYLHIRPRDLAGNIGDQVTVSVVIDTRAPHIFGLADVEGRHQTYTFTWTGFDHHSINTGIPAVISYQYQQSQDANLSLADEGTAPFIDSNQYTTEPPDNTQGLWYFHIRAKDEIDNISEQETYSVYLDKATPIIYGLENDLTATKKAKWSWYTDEGQNVQYRYTIASTIPTDLEGETYGNDLSASKNSGDGTFYLNIQARDEAGNETAVQSYSRLLDNTPPSIDGLSTDTTPVTSKTFTWTTDDTNAEFQFAFAEDEFYEFSDDDPWVTDKTATKAEESGTFFFHIRSRDSAGNISTQKFYTFVLNNSPSLLTGLLDPVGGVSHSTPAKNHTWNWDSKNPVSGDNVGDTYRYIINQDTSPQLSDFEGIPYSDTKTATQVGGDGIYYIHVQVKGNTGVESAIISSPAVLDNTAPPPGMECVYEGSPAHKAVCTLVSSEEGVEFRYIEVDSATPQPGDDDAGWSEWEENVQLTYETAGTHIIYYQGRDEAGNVGLRLATIVLVAKE